MEFCGYLQAQIRLALSASSTSFILPCDFGGKLSLDRDTAAAITIGDRK